MKNLCWLLSCLLFSGCGQSTPDASTAPVGYWREVGSHDSFGPVRTSVYFGEDHSYASEYERLDTQQITSGVHYFDAWRMKDGMLERQMPSGLGYKPGWSGAAFQWLDRDRIKLDGLEYERAQRLPSQQ
jgi:hypothetical protein